MIRTVVWRRDKTPLRKYQIDLPLRDDGTPQPPAAYVAEARRTKSPPKRENDPHGRYDWHVPPSE